MQKGDFCAATWQQLQKDARLAGLVDFPSIEPTDLASMIETLDPFIRGLMVQPAHWQGFLYRVDLPVSIPWHQLSTQEILERIIFRSFQKVWLRTHYSNTSHKPADAPTKTL